MNFKIVLENRRSIAQIQQKFFMELNEKQILNSTAKALNITTRKVQGYIRKEILANYTVNRRYVENYSKVRKYAKGSVGGLYSELSFSYRPTPMVAFKHTGGRNRKGGVSVQIKKGYMTTFRHAFVATMGGTKESGEHFEHEGVFGAGRYTGKGFAYENGRTASGKQKITELRTASAFTMATTKQMQSKIREYVAKDLSNNLRYLLQRKVDRLTKR